MGRSALPAVVRIREVGPRDGLQAEEPVAPKERAALVDALDHGAAGDDHLRYEAAWHLAKNGDGRTFAEIGVPAWDVVSGRAGSKIVGYELTGDRARVLGELA